MYNYFQNCSYDYSFLLFSVPNLFLNGVMTFFLIVLLLFFRPIYRRLLAEKIAEVNDVLNVTIEAEVPTS